MSRFDNDGSRDSAGIAPGGAVSSNPFSTRFVRPGALPYIFPPGDGAQQLIARLRANNWLGQIIGAHGSGKSTLLAAVIPELERAGRAPRLIALHDAERSLAAHRTLLAGAGPGTIITVDGFEQLSRWNRWRLKRFCRRRRCGLLVTAHATVGLPTLLATAVDARTAAEVFRLLVPQPDTVGRADLDQAWAAHSGNLREALFDLYDLYEVRRRRMS
jgi:hypothetical protein